MITKLNNLELWTVVLDEKDEATTVVNTKFGHPEKITPNNIYNIERWQNFDKNFLNLTHNKLKIKYKLL